MNKLFSALLLLSVPVAAQKPNIIYIMSDDHDADAISAYNKRFITTPNIDRLATEGVLFKNAFVGNSICSPARATLLTGQHSHKNAVKDNRTAFDTTRITIPKILNDAGYQTAIIGKWHLHSYPAHFTYWKVLPGQGLYYDPRFVTMKHDTIAVKGYATDVITSEALEWLKTRDQSKPFMLLLHHKAPHRNWMPRSKYLRQTSQQVFPEPTTLYEDMAAHGKAWQGQKMSILQDMLLSSDLKVDPADLRDIPGLKPGANDIAIYNASFARIPEAEKTALKELFRQRGKMVKQYHADKRQLLKLKYQWYMQDYMACVASIDENVGRLLAYLDSSGLAKNTVVMYTGDQGFYLGENGWFDKRWMYDVSMRAPLLVRWPGRIRPGTVNNELVQNIDFAPTILDLAATEIPSWMQGLSLTKALTENESLRRDYLYYHYYEYPIDHYVAPHLGVRSKNFKLIYFYTYNEWEFYDLRNDPQERKNLINSGVYAKDILHYKAVLNQLRDLYDDHEAAGDLH